MATSTKILLTGFEPFGGLVSNPSGEGVKVAIKAAFEEKKQKEF